MNFGIIFIGSRTVDYPEKPVYTIPQNVVFQQYYYLFDPQTKTEQPKPARNQHALLPEIREMHQAFCAGNLDQLNGGCIHRILDDSTGLSHEQFLHSETAWQFIVEQYQRHTGDSSFVEYFWTIRNMHHPIWQLSRIRDTAPNTKVIHSVSTGYAGFLGSLIQQRQQAPLLVSEHGIYTKERRIDLLYQDWDAPKPEHIQKVWLQFFEVLAKIAYHAATNIISLFSQYRLLQIRYGAPEHKTRIIANGVDLIAGKALLAKRDTLTQKAKPIICFLGRVVPIKDLKTCIRAMSILQRDLADFFRLDCWARRRRAKLHPRM